MDNVKTYIMENKIGMVKSNNCLSFLKRYLKKNTTLKLNVKIRY